MKLIHASGRLLLVLFCLDLFWRPVTVLAGIPILSGLQETAVNSTGRPLTFASNRLRALYQHFDLAERQAISVQAIEMPANGKTYRYKVGEAPELPSIRVTIDPNDQVTHIGFDVFTRDEMAAIAPAGLFVEEYFLYLVSSDIERLLDNLEADHIVIEINGRHLGTLGAPDFYEMLGILTAHTEVALVLQDYRFSLTGQDDAANRVRITFPARLDLISGRDKKELDDALHVAIKSLDLQPAVRSPIEGVSDSSLQPYRGDLRLLPGASLHPGLTADRYYRGSQDGIRPLFDPAYPLESLRNVLSAPAPRVSINIRLVHEMYGQERMEYELPLAVLVGFLEKNHDIYVGLEIGGDGSVKSTQLFKDRIFDVSHMLVIDWPKGLLWSSANVSVVGVLYTHIRDDNVQDLYGTYIEQLDAEKFSVTIDQE